MQLEPISFWSLDSVMCLQIIVSFCCCCRYNWPNWPLHLIFVRKCPLYNLDIAIRKPCAPCKTADRWPLQVNQKIKSPGQFGLPIRCCISGRCLFIPHTRTSVPSIVVPLQAHTQKTIRCGKCELPKDIAQFMYITVCVRKRIAQLTFCLNLALNVYDSIL